MKPIVTLFAVLAIALTSAAQQQAGSPQFTVKQTTAVFLGKTKPLNELVRLQHTSAEKEKKVKQQKMAPENFIGRKNHNNVVFPEKEHQGPDPLRQQGGGTQLVEPIVNIDGIGDFGSPHDPTGEVGKDHFVQAVNVTDVGVFDKEGNLLDEFAMATLWSGLGVSSAGDPIVLYDETAERWVITEFTFPANLLVAVSETSDPMGSYNAYNFTTPEFPDYPKYSIWPNAYLVTTNESGAAIHTQYFIDRQAMLNGDATVTIQQVEVQGSTNTEQGFIVSTPVDWDGELLPDTDPVVLALDDSSWGNVDEDAIRLYTFDVDFDNANNTTVTEASIVTTPYDSYPCSVFGFGFQCVPQMGGDGLDAIPETILNIPKYRNFGTHESIVLCFPTDVTNGANLAGLRWVELRKVGNGDWDVYQEGTYGNADGYDTYMGSIAIDEDGNIGMGFTVSSENLYAGLRYTGRYSSDPLGTMTLEEYVVVEGEGPINSGGRYGDYAHMSVDPENGNTFWFTSEYARQGGSGVGTRIVAFELQRDTFDLAVTEILSPITSESFTTSELLTISIKNVGIEPMSNFTISFDFNGIPWETIPIAGPINADETEVYEFTAPMDMSADGVYTITAYVNHPDDTGEFNNSLTTDVENQLSLNAQVDFSVPEVTCGTEITGPFTIANFGAQTLTSGDIVITLNGTEVQSIDWTGNIATGDDATVDVTVTGLVVGVNELTIAFENPNGGADEIPVDNSLTLEFSSVGAGGAYQIVVQTDGYPGETTWVLADDQGNEIVSDGPLTAVNAIHITEVCLTPDECYVFTIYDSWGDGICCDFGQGYYQVINPDGLIVGSGGSFGFEQSSFFCAVPECSLTADVDIITDSGLGDGALYINAANGVEPYQYSIDGGDTFQSAPLFENLDAGTYNIVVTQAGDDCTYETTITILLISVTDIAGEMDVVVKPNPSDGYFQLELTGYPAGTDHLRFQVLDSNGKLVQERNIQRYDDVFVTRVSLVAYASGTYFIRFPDSHVTELLKVIKE